MQNINKGWIYGFIGMTIFSASLPATRAAVGSFDPIFLTLARGSIAGLLGLSLLLVFREKRPRAKDLLSLLIVALGVVIGFPLLTAYALEHVTAAHSTVFIGLLPLATAIFGVLRGNEKPQAIFWLFSLLGSTLVAGYALIESAGSFSLWDFLMFAAIVLCGLAYAEGAKLSRRLGGWQVISWALVLSLPLMIPITFYTMPDNFNDVTTPAWIGLAYVSLFSMLIGFIFWYRGLVEGGIASVGQLQLLQPFFSLILAALLLGETVNMAMMIITLGVVLCVGGAKRFGQKHTLAHSTIVAPTNISATK